MVAGREKQHLKRVPRIEKFNMRLLPIAAIYGGNASGKTNLFRALSFARHLIVKGTQPEAMTATEPFRLDPAFSKRPTRLSFELFVDDRCYEFGFSVTRERVVEEWLTDILKTTEKELYHRKGDEIGFEMKHESDGTMRVIDLIPAFLELAKGENGKVFVIDEIDRSLHTLLTRELLAGYLESCSPDRRSQLLFTTHDVLLMDQKLFRRDEMWVTERDNLGCSSLFPFSDYKDVRSDKDVRKSYLQGRFGGIPRIVRDLEEAKRSLIGEKSLQDPRLIGMDLDELNSHFAGILDEVDTQASLFILAATEATMRVDFLSRVYEKKKDPVSRSFRSTYASRCKHNKVNVRLEEDILDTWVDLHPETKSDIGRLKGAIGYRHWLAHGRYWVPKLGERYDPIGLVQMITNFFEKIGLNDS